MNKEDKRHKTSTRERALHRLKIIQGHLRKVETMLDDGEYCVDIVHQSRAVQKALKKLDLLLIENHLETCVAKQMQNGKSKKATAELLRLFDYK